MSYKHLTINEHAKIEFLLEEGFSIRAIAHKLKRHPSTISRELTRHTDCSADQAQERYRENKTRCGAKLKLTPEVKEAVQEKLEETWSPEQIVGRLYQGKLSFKSIYRWLYNGLLEKPLTVLRQKGKRQKPRETRGSSILVHPLPSVPKKFAIEEHLVIGNSIPLYQAAGRQRAA